MSGTGEQGSGRGAVGDGQRGDEAARLPSLEEQTPGLDEQTVERTEADAKAFYKGGGGAGQKGDTDGGDASGDKTVDLEQFAQAAGNREGADEGEPPAGDVRTVYENERDPGQARPQGGDRSSR